MGRESLIAKTVSLLHKNGFDAETFFESDNCFDIIARKGALTLVLKLYENIDSIRKEQGEELGKLSTVLGASCIIIGEKTKVFSLEDGVMYSRYGIPTLAKGTFQKLLGEKMPRVRYFKGRQIVDIDAEELRKKRLGMELSLGGLAERVGVTPESMYRFEKGASTSLGTALRLERELREKLIREADVLAHHKKKGFEDEMPKDKLLEKMHELGMKMALFGHSPFKAYTDSEKGIFIGTGKGKADIPRKAVELRKASAVIDTDSIIITKEYRQKSVEGVPVIEEQELESISRPKDLRKMIRERENKE